jgi:hypothetical protein
MPDRITQNTEPEWEARLRARGYHVTVGTAESLAEPECVMPPRASPRGVGLFTTQVRRFWQRHRLVRAKDATLP